MARHRSALYSVSLFLAGAALACEGDTTREAEVAADRVTSTADQLRHQRRELAVRVAERADDLAEDPQRAAGRSTEHATEIADEARDVMAKAGAHAEARAHFERWRAARVHALRIEHSVLAIQPLLIETLAGVTPLTDHARQRLAEDVAIFRLRLGHAREAIDLIESADADQWRERDDAVRRLNANVSLARDSAWRALNDGDRRTSS